MIIFKELINIFQFFFFNIPGNIGIKLREFFIKLYFWNFNLKIIIHHSAEIKLLKNIKFKELVSIQKRSYISAENAKLSIGNNTHFNFENLIIADGGEIVIGNNCIFGPRVIIRSSNHRYENKNENIIDQGHKANKIIIEDDVWVGAGVIILPGSIIKTGSVVSAGSIVRGTIEPYGIYSSTTDIKKIKSRI